ncbi:choice-of-anchor P family protein [Acrocarpospora catenulata]|uniref:choice-of-anchor P family protein n=1 Tax=Acrocarpospora catenulata TaxID=2836182 RepID=UPI001BD9E576|nr:choice-of-anchor P family protein [Acrocarpospora catenulata]
MTTLAKSAFTVSLTSVLCVLMPAGRASAAADIEAFGVQATLAVLTVGPARLANLGTPSASTPSIRAGSGANQISTGVATADINQDTAAGTEHAEATVANLGATIAGIGLTATSVDVQCDAAGGATSTGSTTITGGNLAGTPLASDPAPNTTISFPALLPALTVTLNRQVADGDRLTVQGIHITTVGGTGEVIAGQARCGPADLDAPPPVPLDSSAGLYLGLGLAGATVAGMATLRLRRRGTVLA